MSTLLSRLRRSPRPAPLLPEPSALSTARAGTHHPALHTPDPAVTRDPQRHSDPHDARHLHRIQALARAGHWRAYRDARLAYADDLLRRGRPLHCLDLLLEIWYLDLNGPRDRVEGPQAGGARLDMEDPPFLPSQGGTAPAVARAICRLVEGLGMDRAAVEVAFFAVAGPAYRNFALPLSPKQLWPQLALLLLGWDA